MAAALCVFAGGYGACWHGECVFGECVLRTVGVCEWRLRFRFTLAQLKARLEEAAGRVGMVSCSCITVAAAAEWRLQFRFTLAQRREGLAEAAARVGMVSWCDCKECCLCCRWVAAVLQVHAGTTAGEVGRGCCTHGHGVLV